MANLNATLTCPHCGHDAHVMPTDRCVVVYDCSGVCPYAEAKGGGGTAVCFVPTLIVRALPSKTQNPRATKFPGLSADAVDARVASIGICGVPTCCARTTASR